MIIDLESIFNVEGLSADLDYQIDMSGEELDGAFPFKTPVSVKGRVANSTGIVEINAEASYELTVACSRCARETVHKMNTEICHTLVRQVEDENNDDFLTVTDLRYDLDPLVREDILLSMPYKFLCADDCKGLCPKCGKNLNEGPCSCKPETDPRLEALKQLLDNNE
jgi:uncharacterized protein